MPTDARELEIGDKAPDFDLPTDGAGKLRLSDLRGRRVVLYFYPKDNTSGCTKEACRFNEELPDFRKLKAEIVGVSRDSITSHDGFRKKYRLGFKLVADVDGKACAAYGTWVEKSMYGRKYMGIDRATFLIDEKGVIRGVWRKVKVPGHVEAVLAAAKAL
ncbi:MAG TPA: peroxiredoxin [Alphaproteobacteria bacterium]|jgi:peroxiredoxin Q/BCP|nr:peroxiredoxin [Alphaproteobacteria bacterium]